jgi:uncharacterized protein YecT (DUF1311 family)
MKLLLLCLPLCLCLTVSAQVSKSTVDSLEKQYQECLSQGGSQYSCALEYYTAMDTLLNKVYHQVYKSMDDNQREMLMTSQEQWTERKEAYFRDIDIRVEKKRPQTLSGLDDDMIVTDNKAAYIKSRVIELLGKAHS